MLNDIEYSDVVILDCPEMFAETERTKHLKRVKTEHLPNKLAMIAKHRNLIVGDLDIPVYYMPPVILNASLYCVPISVCLMYIMALREIVDTRIHLSDNKMLKLLRQIQLGVKNIQEIMKSLFEFGKFDYELTKEVNLLILKHLDMPNILYISGCQWPESIPDHIEYVVTYQTPYVPKGFKQRSAVLYNNGHVILEYQFGHSKVYHDNDLKAACKLLDKYQYSHRMYKRLKSEIDHSPVVVVT